MIVVFLVLFFRGIFFLFGFLLFFIGPIGLPALFLEFLLVFFHLLAFFHQSMGTFFSFFSECFELAAIFVGFLVSLLFGFFGSPSGLFVFGTGPLSHLFPLFCSVFCFHISSSLLFTAGLLVLPFVVFMGLCHVFPCFADGVEFLAGLL